MSKIAVSIIIVTYNSKKYLIDCLNSILLSQTKSIYEIIVIDNDSNDDTSEVVPSQFKNVKFIHNRINNGFAFANNQGIVEAKGKYLFLLNPDTLILDNAIDIMVEFLESNENAGACGCKVLNDDGSLQPSFFGFPTLVKEIGHLFRLDRMRWLIQLLKSYKWLRTLARTNLSTLSAADTVMEVDYLLGACLMMKTSVIEKVGPLDDKIFMYIEDTEMCYRIKANGYRVYYIPHGKIVHFGGKSSATNDQHMLMEYTRSRLYFYRKCYGRFSTYALKSIIIAHMLSKMVTIWFSKHQLEMQQLQTRYKSSSDVEANSTRGTTIPDRIVSFKLYVSILVMTIYY
jgi:GT2 family glycosyltransferase